MPTSSILTPKSLAHMPGRPACRSRSSRGSCELAQQEQPSGGGPLAVLSSTIFVPDVSRCACTGHGAVSERALAIRGPGSSAPTLARCRHLLARRRWPPSGFNDCSYCRTDIALVERPTSDPSVAEQCPSKHIRDRLSVVFRPRGAFPCLADRGGDPSSVRYIDAIASRPVADVGG